MRDKRTQKAHMNSINAFNPNSFLLQNSYSPLIWKQMPNITAGTVEVVIDS